MLIGISTQQETTLEMVHPPPSTMLISGEGGESGDRDGNQVFHQAWFNLRWGRMLIKAKHDRENQAHATYKRQNNINVSNKNVE